jgi:hypothetical protein
MVSGHMYQKILQPSKCNGPYTMNKNTAIKIEKT